MSKLSQQQKLALKIAVIALIGLLASTLLAYKFVPREAQALFRKSSVPTHMFSVGFMGDIFRELGLLRPKLVKGEHEMVLPLKKKQARLSFWVDSTEAIDGIVRFETTAEDSAEKHSRSVTFSHPKGNGVVSLYLDDIHNLTKVSINRKPDNAQVTFENVKLAQKGVIDYKPEGDDFSVREGLSGQNGKVDDICFSVDPARVVDNKYNSLFKRKRFRSSYNLLASNNADVQVANQNKGYRHPGIATVNIYTDEANITGADGIKSNYLKHGREYERLAIMTYYSAAGRHVVTSPVGLRYHGGARRGEFDSYKVYFRKEYGSTDYRHRYIFDNPLPVNSFVIHHTEFPVFSSVSHLLAMDIVESLGGIIPRRKPVIFNLNGEYQGFYYITDHLSKKNFRDWLGNNDFYFYRYKSAIDKNAKYALDVTLSDLKNIPRDQVMDYIEQRWDLDSFTQIMIANTYFNNYDYCQGVHYRERGVNDNRWKTVGWDFDGAFTVDGNYSWPRWNDETTVVNRLNKELRRCYYISVFRLLLNTQSEYREYFFDKFTKALNGPLASNVLLQRLEDYYETYKNVPKIRLQAYEAMKEYFNKRGDFLYKNLRKTLSDLHNNDPNASKTCSFCLEK